MSENNQMEDKNEVARMLEFSIQKKKAEYQLYFDKNFEEQEQTLTLIAESIKHSRLNQLHTSEFIWNLAGFINLVSFDFKMIFRDLLLSNIEWEKKLYSRQVYLLIYESIDDILILCGQKMKHAIKDFKNKEILLDELKSTIGKLNSFKKEHEQSFKDIRNKAIAHREHDVLEQLKTIITINWIDSIVLFTKYDEILNELGSFVGKLINESYDELSNSEVIQ